MKKNTLFLTLKIFTTTGGIEKVCRIVGKTLFESSIIEDRMVEVYSMHDKLSDSNNNKYFPAEIYRAFNKNKISFSLHAIYNSRKYNTIILSHVNLILIGWIIKFIHPKTKLILFAHGIEVWKKFGLLKRLMLRRCDLIIPVSHFTLNKLVEQKNVAFHQCKVINNCLDPFLPIGKEFTKENLLRNKYGYTKDDIIMFTLTRISSSERYKGYDKVIQALHNLTTTHPNIKYLIAGSYDAEEKKYINELALSLGLENHIKLPGFIADEDLVEHFCMADLYIMPSMKEGFGIVFIEAMFYGLPVIAGNKDGSVDALLNGELGILVNPLEINEIETAIKIHLENKSNYSLNRKKLLSNFSYESYKHKLEQEIYN